MTHMKLMSSHKGETGRWLVTLTDAKSKTTTGRFTINPAYGSIATRFLQGVAKATGFEVLFLAAQSVTKHEVRIPVVNTSADNRDALANQVVESLERVYNRFISLGRTPVFETWDRRHQWEVEATWVQTTRQSPPEEHSTYQIDIWIGPERKTFRETF